jgi:Golgi phosphoprotein 3
MSRHDLTLREQLLLISLDAKKGSFLDPTIIQYGLAGAILVELAARKRIGLDAGFLVPIDGPRTGDALLEEVLALISEAKRRKKMKDWVRVLPGKLKGLHNRVALGLVDRGILKEAEDTVLWVFPVKRYPERTPAPERELRERIRRAVAGSRRIDQSTGTLVALMAACRLTRRVFAPDRRREADRRIKELIRSEAFKRIVGETTLEIHAGVTVVAAAAGRS